MALGFGGGGGGERGREREIGGYEPFALRAPRHQAILGDVIKLPSVWGLVVLLVSGAAPSCGVAHTGSPAAQYLPRRRDFVSDSLMQSASIGGHIKELMSLEWGSFICRS